MEKNKSYDFIRIPSKSWDVLMETVTLDGSYSEQIKREVWDAIEKIQIMTNFQIVLQITEGIPTQSYILANKKSAMDFAKKLRESLPPNGHVFCLQPRFRKSKN